MHSRIAVTTLTSTMGARVDGIDLREDLTEDVREQLRQALWDHHVVVVPSQEVGLDGQNRLTTCFGPLEPGPTFSSRGVKPHCRRRRRRRCRRPRAYG
jgi:alpha-ketoglutarate-dependent taurine dioxygenase